ncbi:hypothetical protein FACS1894152_5370 [Bacilli bacterium]|nr:hypothetical protein FACS1894152_5370 [Bacilli bacterium]
MKTMKFKSLFISILALHLVFGVGGTVEAVASTREGNNCGREENQEEREEQSQGRFSRWFSSGLAWFMSFFTTNEPIRVAGEQIAREEERFVELRRRTTEAEEHTAELRRHATQVREHTADLERRTIEAGELATEFGGHITGAERHDTWLGRHIVEEEGRVANAEREATELGRHITRAEERIHATERRGQIATRNREVFNRLLVEEHNNRDVNGHINTGGVDIDATAHIARIDTNVVNENGIVHVANRIYFDLTTDVEGNVDTARHEYEYRLLWDPGVAVARHAPTNVLVRGRTHTLIPQGANYNPFGESELPRNNPLLVKKTYGSSLKK